MLLLCALAGLFLALQISPALANPKYASIVVDGNTGTVLHDRHADKRRYPASLTKMMTLYVLFEEIEAGHLSLTTPIPVSANAARQPASKLGLKAGSHIPLEDAILALVIKSANDVATAVAEHVGGSEKEFAQRMTRTAKSLGMYATQFRNASGLPNRQQYTTARDMALLGRRIRLDFPEHYHYFSNSQFTYKGKRYRGHNKLVRNYNGADGIKTGYIRASGFNLVSSIERDGKRLVAVVLGGRSAKRRDDHSVALLNRYLPRATRMPQFHVGLPQGPLANPLRLAKAETSLPPSLPSTIVTTANAKETPAPIEKNAGSFFAELVLQQGTPPEPLPIPKAPKRPASVNLASILPTLIPPLPRAPLQEDDEFGAVGSGEIGLEEIFRLDPQEGAWSIQLETHDNPTHAKEHLLEALAHAPQSLQDAKAIILPVALGDGRTHYWSGFSGFETTGQASAACFDLRPKDISCKATASLPSSSLAPAP